jgi:hypothetical protein
MREVFESVRGSFSLLEYVGLRRYAVFLKKINFFINFFLVLLDYFDIFLNKKYFKK